jgi:hypothetical protein
MHQEAVNPFYNEFCVPDLPTNPLILFEIELQHAFGAFDHEEKLVWK